MVHEALTNPIIYIYGLDLLVVYRLEHLLQCYRSHFLSHIYSLVLWRLSQVVPRVFCDIGLSSSFLFFSMLLSCVVPWGNCPWVFTCMLQRAPVTGAWRLPVLVLVPSQVTTNKILMIFMLILKPLSTPLFLSSWPAPYLEVCLWPQSEISSLWGFFRLSYYR